MKIDIEFVRDLVENPQNQHVVKAIGRPAPIENAFSDADSNPGEQVRAIADTMTPQHEVNRVP